MKHRLIACLILISAVINFCPLKAGAEIRFSAGIEINSPADFSTPLSPYGQWVDVRSYGRCWHPNVAVGWRPYCNGSWEWTDCGWYWASDDPWAWACYHYGSWVYDSSYGWVWIPGTEWAPAWVNWRYSDDYVGWAPCGPGGVVLAPSFFVFVGIGHFHDRIRPNAVIVNNTTIINRTTVINNFARETRTFGSRRETVVVNRGPSVERIQRASGGARFTPTPIVQAVSRTPVPSTIRRSEAEGIRHERFVQEPTRSTGSEQPRVYQPQEQLRRDREQPESRRNAPAANPAPVTPRSPREQQRVAPQQPPAQVAPERPPARVAPERPPGPPTGWERGNGPRNERNERVQPPPAQVAPPARPRPPVRETPPPQDRERGRDKDKDRDRPGE